jgi:hypothetical protein
MGPTLEESMRTSLTRALAGTAIAAAAVLTAVGTASAAGATVKAPTTLTLTEQHAVIKAGDTDLLTGTLMSGKTPLSGKAVELDRFVSGKPVFVDAKITGIHGHVFFTVKPGKTTRYQLVFAGDKTYLGTRSNIATVVVVPARSATQLSIVASKTTIKPGGSATISGTLTSGKTVLAGQLVWLCQVVKGKLSGCSGHFTGGLGRVFFTVKPIVTTRYELVFFGSAKYLPTHSGIVTIVVS